MCTICSPPVAWRWRGQALGTGHPEAESSARAKEGASRILPSLLRGCSASSGTRPGARVAGATLSKVDRCPRSSPAAPDTHIARVGRAVRLALAVDSECMWCTWPPGACVESRGLLPSATFTGTVSPVATVLLACLMADRRGRPEPEPGWAAATAAPKSRNPVLAETGQDCLLLQQKLTYTHEGTERSMPKTVRCVPSTSFNEKAL